MRVLKEGGDKSEDTSDHASEVHDRPKLSLHHRENERLKLFHIHFVDLARNDAGKIDAVKQERQKAPEQTPDRTPGKLGQCVFGKPELRKKRRCVPAEQRGGLFPYRDKKLALTAFGKIAPDGLVDRWGKLLEKSVSEKHPEHRICRAKRACPLGEKQCAEIALGEQDAAVCGFLLAGDVSMIAPNDAGEYVLTVYNDVNKEKTTNIVEKLNALSKSDSAWFWPWGSSSTIDFQSGRALMILANTNRVPYYLNYDINFGVLPYPMYDENQKDVGYRSLQFGGFTCIPSYVSNPQMVGDTLEVLSFFSEDVNVAFYEKLLGKQASDSPDDTRMLQIVWDGIGTDFAQTFYGALMETEIFHLMPRLTPETATEGVASFVGSREASINKRLDKFLKQVKNRK